MSSAARHDGSTGHDPYAALRPLLLESIARLPTDVLHARLTRNRECVCTVYPLLEPSYCAADYLADVLDLRFTENGETHWFETEVDWLRNPSRDLEWHILLHKFYYAGGLAEQFRRTGDVRCLTTYQRLCESWMRQTPIDFIAADVTARRVQNWLYALHTLAAAPYPERPSAEFVSAQLCSIVRQVDYLQENLAPARNHRTLALYAIFLAAIALPELRAAARWREFADRQLCANLDSDFHRDGSHIELSIDYHHLVLRSFALWLRHLRANALPVPPGVEPRLNAAFDFALHLQRPDGVVPALSDGDACDYRALLTLGSTLLERPDLQWAATLGNAGQPPAQSSRAFVDSGYAVLRSGWGEQRRYTDETFVIADCGPLGAGNHGHLDALSFEYFAQGEPQVIDPGRGTYDEHGEINWRAHFRRTAAHNTVTVDGLDQSLYAFSPRHGKFRVHPPLADTSLVRLDASRTPLITPAGQRSAHAAGTVDYLHGRVQSHCYPARHDRRWLRVGARYLLVFDDLCSSDQHTYRWHFHLAANAHGATVLRVTPTGCHIDTPSLGIDVQSEDSSLAAELSTDLVAPRYGSWQDAPLIVVAAHAQDTRVVTLLAAHPTQQPPARLHAASSRDWHDIVGVRHSPNRRLAQLGAQLWRVALPEHNDDTHDIVGCGAPGAGGAFLAQVWQLDRLRFVSPWFIARRSTQGVEALWLPGDADRCV